MASRDPRLSRSVVAIMNARRTGSSADLEEAQRDHAFTRLLVAVEREIQRAKPLSDDQLHELNRLFQGTTGTESRAS